MTTSISRPTGTNDNKHQRRDDQRAGVRLDWEDTPPAGTTQSVKHGDVPSTEFTLRQAEALVEVFGGHDAEVSVIQRPDAWPHLDLGLYAYFTEYPGEGTFYLGPTEVDDDLAANGRAVAAPIRTWRERIGQPADFPLHAPTDVERAMQAEIAELRALVVAGGVPPAPSQQLGKTRCANHEPGNPDSCEFSLAGRGQPSKCVSCGMPRAEVEHKGAAS